MQIRLKRAYDEPSPQDGQRILVDRLWPRGVSKEDLEIDRWAKELAPSDGLRTWFGHDPDKWEEFRKRYFEELDGKEEVEHLCKEYSDRRVTLVFAARDEERNNAAALKDYLEGRC